MKIQPVIMSGGAGTRLWPLSRSTRPKQFLKLVTDNTMFQETVLRTPPSQDTGYEPPVIIAGRTHGGLVSDQLAEVGISPAEIILEPCPRNTAAVAAVASAWVAARDEDALILLTPADHHIEDAEAFRQRIEDGAQAARDGAIVTFGIKPHCPHTGYGYIHAGGELREHVFRVAAFKEKPKQSVAQNYLDDGGYYWNAGIFLFSASAMIEELKKFAPDIFDTAEKALTASVLSGAARRLDEEIFSTCPSDSIDYAVMEKTDQAAIVAPVDVGWTDIGSWSEVTTPAEDPRIVEIDSSGNVVRSDGPAIATIGVENLIIAATSDAVLVAKKEDAQRVREIVERLKSSDRSELL